MMPWLAVTLGLDAEAAEAFSEALLAAGAKSVALEGGRLSAILEAHQDASALMAVAAQSAGVAVPRFSVQRLEDRDWVCASQEQFAPLRLGRLWIGATWHKAPTSAAVIARIDPGLAFGTGSHPSTKLILAFLERTLAGGERVLDYGCGSGILAIAAAKLGAVSVDAVDVDVQAVEATAMNARLNQVEVRAFAPESLPRTSYDLVLSNILFQPLVVLAPLLAARTARGGRIALTGILEGQAAELKAAYAEWFDATTTAAREDGWALVTGVRR
jgi:ribosomal protein L11 methyltransferase